MVRRLIDEARNQGKVDVIDELADEGFVGPDPAVGGEFDRESVKPQIAGSGDSGGGDGGDGDSGSGDSGSGSGGSDSGSQLPDVGAP